MLILVNSVLLTAQERETPPIKLEKISGNVYQILGGAGSNGGLIIGENEVLVIDAKMSEYSVNQTIEAIGGLTDKAINYLVNTHSDGDHIMGNRFYHPEEKIAFLGDQYFSTRPQLIHSNKNGNSFEHVKTLTKMLETLDAEVFLSGHSDPVGRDEIRKHIQVMVEKQLRVKELVSQDLTLGETLKEFNENETRLVTSIYNEIKGDQGNQSTANPY